MMPDKLSDQELINERVIRCRECRWPGECDESNSCRLRLAEAQFSKNDLTDGVKLLRHAAIGGLSRSQFPSACAQALLNRLEALEVELRKYEPSLPSVLPPEPNGDANAEIERLRKYLAEITNLDGEAARHAAECALRGDPA